MVDIGAYAVHEDSSFHRVKVGEFTICRFDDESLWIEQDGGEGGQFKETAFAEAVRKFYEDNF